MITIHPAANLGIDHRVGSLEVGKDGDIAIFSHYPLHTPARVEMTIIEGEVYFDRSETDLATSWVFDSEGGEEGGR
jgi:imidazolonepropionase-like amidohydrolase